MVRREVEAISMFYNIYFLGFFTFSSTSEQAEKTLFDQLADMKNLLNMDDKEAILMRAFCIGHL